MITLDLAPYPGSGPRISPYLHSVFGEFYGRVIYDGIWVGRDSAIPNVDGLRRDVIAGCREAGVTAMRWPGGCCADHYHWRDGIGPVRYPRIHPDPDPDPLWRHDFGTDEFMRFCTLIGAEPILIANTATGTPQEFLDWFEYCNGPAETRYGGERARNGHPEPYNVRIWGLGNTDENVWFVNHRDPEDYARRFLQWRTAIRELTNDLTLIGLGLSDRHGREGWVERFLDYATDGQTKRGPDVLSIHRYVGGGHGINPEVQGSTTFSDDAYHALLSLTSLYQHDIDLHRRYIAEHTSPRWPVTIAYDEWGVWHPEATVGTGTHQPQPWRDGMFAACLLHTFYRNCDIVQYAMVTQLSNLLQSLYETDGPRFFKTPTHYVLKLFQEHLGQERIEVEAHGAAGRLDLVASRTADGRRITLTLINKDLDAAQEISLPTWLSGWRLLSADVIAPPDVRCLNSFAQPELVRDQPLAGATCHEAQLPAHSVSRLVLESPN